jgi:hypothetical protein
LFWVVNEPPGPPEEYRGCDTAAVPPSVPVRLLETGLSLSIDRQRVLIVNLLRFVVEGKTKVRSHTIVRSTKTMEDLRKGAYFQ